MLKSQLELIRDNIIEETKFSAYVKILGNPKVNWMRINYFLGWEQFMY